MKMAQLVAVHLSAVKPAYSIYHGNQNYAGQNGIIINKELDHGNMA